MTKMFTQNDLLRYIYGETSQEEDVMIEVLLKTDSKLQKLYSQLIEAKEDVDGLLEAPSEKVIQNILSNSQSFNLHSV